MASIEISDMNFEVADMQPITAEEAAQMMGGTDTKPNAKSEETYLKYEVENVPISSWQ